MDSFIKDIYRTGLVQDAEGNELSINLDSCINESEGLFLADLIRSDASITQTLEVGCGYGLSSLFICSALKQRPGAKHRMIDPLQESMWKRIGILNLERAGYAFAELLEKPSEFILPELAERTPAAFDLVFIDGWHTFDHTLLDLFYANLLIRVGGYIVIDDCLMPSVAKAVSYMANYPSYEIFSQRKYDFWQSSLPRKMALLMSKINAIAFLSHFTPMFVYNRFLVRFRYSSMIALRKIVVDDRSWRWFSPFW